MRCAVSPVRVSQYPQASARAGRPSAAALRRQRVEERVGRRVVRLPGAAEHARPAAENSTNADSSSARVSSCRCTRRVELGAQDARGAARASSALTTPSSSTPAAWMTAVSGCSRGIAVQHRRERRAIGGVARRPRVTSRARRPRARARAPLGARRRPGPAATTSTRCRHAVGSDQVARQQRPQRPGAARDQHACRADRAARVAPWSTTLPTWSRLRQLAERAAARRRRSRTAIGGGRSTPRANSAPQLVEHLAEPRGPRLRSDRTRGRRPAR